MIVMEAIGAPLSFKRTPVAASSLVSRAAVAPSPSASAPRPVTPAPKPSPHPPVQSLGKRKVAPRPSAPHPPVQSLGKRKVAPAPEPQPSGGGQRSLGKRRTGKNSGDGGVTSNDLPATPAPSNEVPAAAVGAPGSGAAPALAYGGAGAGVGGGESEAGPPATSLATPPASSSPLSNPTILYAVGGAVAIGLAILVLRRKSK